MTVAGEGPTRDQAEALCADLLPSGSWRFEDAPEDAIARLAAADVVVAQGSTTLEAAALGRRVVVARSAGRSRAAGVVLRPENYEDAAGDPFGTPKLTTDFGELWEGLLDVEEDDLRAVRDLVERETASRRGLRRCGRRSRRRPRSLALVGGKRLQAGVPGAGRVGMDPALVHLTLEPPEELSGVLQRRPSARPRCARPGAR